MLKGMFLDVSSTFVASCIRKIFNQLSSADPAMDAGS